jgi:cell division protein FtsL
VTKPATCCRQDAVRLTGMEAVFIALMAAVVLLSGFVSVLVIYKLMKADNS